MKREKLIGKITCKYSEPPQEQAERDEYFMRCALELARAAAGEDEVPVGAVVVRDGRIVAGDFNGREKLRDATYPMEAAQKGDKTCYGCNRTSDHRSKCVGNRMSHCPFLISRKTPLILLVTVPQENRIVHRNSQLENCTQSLRNI